MRRINWNSAQQAQSIINIFTYHFHKTVQLLHVQKQMTESIFVLFFLFFFHLFIYVVFSLFCCTKYNSLRCWLCSGRFNHVRFDHFIREICELFASRTARIFILFVCIAVIIWFDELIESML